MPLRRKSGRVTFLRAQDRGSGYGPGDDHIDGEFVGAISSAPDERFGETLRDDGRMPANRAMFDLLRDGLVEDDLETTVVYDVPEGKSNGIVWRVELRPD